MNPLPALSDATIAIWGLGLMGGSLAMALRGKCARLLGIDPDPETLTLARHWNVVDAAAADPAALLPQADVVILAAPVRVILRLLADLPQHHPGSPLVMDIGSTKQAIAAAMSALPPRFDVLGGHPMCGKEKSSLRFAEAGIFINAPFALTALPRSSEAACAWGETLVQAVRGRLLWIDPALHDAAVAASSHTPFLLSAALAASTPPEAAALIGTGFRSTARLAGSSTRMMLDILITNRLAIRTALGRVRGTLAEWDALLEAEDWDTLAARLEQAARQYDTLCG